MATRGSMPCWKMRKPAPAMPVQSAPWGFMARRVSPSTADMRMNCTPAGMPRVTMPRKKLRGKTGRPKPMMLSSLISMSTK